MSLATKYRPTTFEEVCAQKTIIKILNKQLELKQYPNCYMFCGKSGCGKTTIARILANKINNNCGSPIEIDGASNNGVDNVRSIINEAKERSLDSEYKIFIIDEAQMITNAGWNAFLKCIEETPKYTIFMFCTTDPQKIPETIQNRVMRFNLTSIPSDIIKQRLDYICLKESFMDYEEGTSYISKIVDGSMRDAITQLEKVSNYDKNINLNNVMNVLGFYSYDILFNLTNSIIDSNNQKLLECLKTVFSINNNLINFIDQYIRFVLDLGIYSITKDIKNVNIPETQKDKVDYTINIENNTNYFKWLLNNLLDIKNTLKYDNDIKSTITIKFLQLIRG